MMKRLKLLECLLLAVAAATTWACADAVADPSATFGGGGASLAAVLVVIFVTALILHNRR